MHTNSYICRCVFTYIFLIPLVTRNLPRHDLGEPTSSDRKFGIPNFRLFLTLKKAFSKGKNNKKVVFLETRELPWRPVGFRGLPRCLEILVLTIFRHYFIVYTYPYAPTHTNSYIYPRMYIYIYVYICIKNYTFCYNIFFYISFVATNLCRPDVGETTSSDRKFENLDLSSIFDPQNGIF